MPHKTWTPETEYLDLLDYVLTKGEQRQDRTGVGTLSIFATSLMFDLVDGFPLFTTKKVPFKAVASELLWFIEGSGDERRLAEILHGTRDPEKKTIWTPNAEGTTGSKYQPRFKGDLGRIYGVQWRSWRSYELKDYSDILEHDDGSTTYFGSKVTVSKTDQLAEVVQKLRTNSTDRRIILSAWNPGELDQMMLPPCHMFAQFYMSADRKLSCQVYQRSADLFLGVPFNVASYSLLIHLLANTVGATPGKLTLVLGDAHIYLNHLDAVKEQLDRAPFGPPTIQLTCGQKEITEYVLDDIQLVGYRHHPPIKAEMAA